MTIKPINERFSQIDLDDSPPSKKQRFYENPASPPAHPVCFPSLSSTEEMARKFFLMDVCFQWLTSGPDELSKRTVFIISSCQQEIAQKERIKAKALLCFKRCVILWVDVPKEAFFKHENFEIMINVFYSIPFGSIIYIQEKNTLLAPKRQKQPCWKDTPSKSILQDKVIFFDPEGSSCIQMIFKIFKDRAPEIPHYYITTGSSLVPFGKLTERSAVYFSEKGHLVLQTTQALTARGFRVMGSLGKKSK
jgi:hypothetical protein